MATVRDIVEAAHRKIGVVSRDEPMDADSAAAGLFAFNAMVHGWKADGVDVEHTDQDLSDTFALASQFIEGSVYLLASRLAPEFQVPPEFDADGFWRRLQSTYATVPSLTVPAALQYPPSRDERQGDLPAITSP